MIGNEYSELTTGKYTDTTMVILFVGLFFIGFRIENCSKLTPNMTNTDTDHMEQSPILQYFFGTFFFWVIGLVLFMFRKLFSYYNPTDLVTFIDLCSIANVSAVFFDGPQHGYYIHGKNPASNQEGGTADGSMANLVKGMASEKLGKLGGRGLDQNDQDQLQTFEIFVPLQLRYKYDEVLLAAKEILKDWLSKDGATSNAKSSDGSELVSGEKQPIEN